MRPFAVAAGLVFLGLFATACRAGDVHPDELRAWAEGYCTIHRDLATDLARATAGEEDPANLSQAERLARARRVGNASISAYTGAALRLLTLPGGGQLREAALARARYYEALAVAWERALQRLARAGDASDFDAVNTALSAASTEADSDWHDALRTIGDAEVAFAAVARTQCR